MDQLSIITVKEVKNLLDTYPDETPFVLLTLNFDKGEKTSGLGELINKEVIGIIAQKSGTIVYSGNKYLSQVDMHSVKQPDIHNIRPKGVLRTVLLNSVNS